MNPTLSTQTQSLSADIPREFRWADVSSMVWMQIAIVAALFVWFFGYDLWGMVHRWSTDASWSHGFLIPLFSLYFLNQKKEQILSQQIRPNWTVGLSLLVLCLVLYPLNIVQFKFGYGRPILMIATLIAMIFFLGGWNLLRYTWLPAGFLFFSIPLPERLYAQITIPLRMLAAEASAVILNVIPELKATVSGVVIDVVYKGSPLVPGLDVAEACSGMRLLMAFVALGVAMAYLHDRPIWQRLILLASTLPIAILCNVVRVTVTGLIYVLWDPRYAQGIYHDLLGLLMLPLAFGLYGFLAWLMGNLYVEEEAVVPQVIIRRNLSQEGKK
ncbi:MAG: exosortase/archaeosortase family protein [Planctomycetes bacterium]|nr:exosortase/archaeosortase family protein [Planctomycetota bacterium]